MEFIKKIKKKIRVPYYYVPPCPICGSYVTGKIIKRHWDNDVEWQVVTALKNGEIVVPVDDPPKETAICLDCGHSWIEDVGLQFFHLDEIEEQKYLRGTREILGIKREEQRQAEKSDKGLLKPIRKYIGKL